MLRGDAEHGGADTYVGVNRNDLLVLERLPQAVDQVDFCAHGPFRNRACRLDRLDNALGRPDLVGSLSDLKTGFGVNDHAYAGMLATGAGNLLRRKALVHRPVALPENDGSLAKRFRSVSSEFLERVPHDHLVEGDAHAIPGIARKVLVGEEKNFFAFLESLTSSRW